MELVSSLQALSLISPTLSTLQALSLISPTLSSLQALSLISLILIALILSMPCLTGLYMCILSLYV